MKIIDGYLDTYQIAKMLGFKANSVVSFFRKLFADFPEPMLDEGKSRGFYYKTEEVLAFFKKHGVKFKEL